jgi:uncharacterized protein YecE (DUF72 family)
VKPIYVGCSGWNYRSWRGGLYPAEMGSSHWLERYAERFDTVEVNATFYRLASAKAVDRWVRQTPGDFRFAVKASRYLTHVKRLAGIEEGIARFYEGLEPMVQAGRLTAVLWQLPESFHRDDARLAQALELLPEGRHAFEFRHPSWFDAGVYALLKQRDAALVVGDHPERPFQSDAATASWRYVRLHYGHGRRGNYSERELRVWAERLSAWRRRRPALVYFNNDWEGFAPRNAARLSALLAPAPSRELVPSGR